MPLIRLVALLALFLGAHVASAAPDPESDEFWYGAAADGTPTVRPVLLLLADLPALPGRGTFIDELAARWPWLELQKYAVKDNCANARFYYETALSLGTKALSVPGFVFCRQVLIGYDTAETTGAEIARALESCHEPVAPEIAARAADVARHAVAAVGGVGSFGVEMFLVRQDEIVLYELAPYFRVLVGLTFLSFSIFGFVFGNRAVHFYIAWIYVMVVPFAVFRYPTDWLNLRFLYMVSLGFCVLLTSAAVYVSRLLADRRVRRFLPFAVPAFYVGLTIVLVTKLDAKNERLAARVDWGPSPAPRAASHGP